MSTIPLVYRKRVILEKFGISETTLRRWMADQGFPLAKQLGPRAVGWIAKDVNEWLDQRPVAHGNIAEDDDD